MPPLYFYRSLKLLVTLISICFSSSLYAAQKVALRSESGAFYLYNVDTKTVDEATSGALSGVTNDTNWVVQAFADLNGDGNSDILLRNSAGAWFGYLIEGGEIVESGEVPITSNPAWEFRAANDFNGDGSADILLRNSSNGTWFLYLLDGLNIPSNGAVNLAFNQDWKFQGTADFNGDGRGDVLLRHQVNQSWFVYALNGTSLDQSGTGLIRFGLNPDWEFAAADDFTGDGKADMIMRRKDGPWWMYEVDGTDVVLNNNFGLLALTGSMAWAYRGTGDFNGDGRKDVLLRRQSDGRWYIYALDGRSKVGGAAEGFVEMTDNADWSFKGIGTAVSPSANVDPFAHYQENVSDIILGQCIVCHVEGGVAAVSPLLYQPSSMQGYMANNYEVLSNYILNATNGGELLLSKALGVSHGGGAQLTSNSEGYQALETLVSLLGEDTGSVGSQSKFWDNVSLADNQKTLRRAALIVAGRLPTDVELAAVADGSEESLKATLRNMMQGQGLHDFLIRGANDRLFTLAFNEGLFLDVLDPNGAMYPVMANKQFNLLSNGMDDENGRWRNKVVIGAALEPLELIARVVRTERPYTEILTANYTMANKELSEGYRSTVSSFSESDGVNVFKVATNNGQIFHDEQLQTVDDQLFGTNVISHSGFVKYPHAGILNTPAYLNRYPTTETNRNRARSRWTHYNFLGLDIEKSANRTTNPEALADTDNPTLKNPNCTVCHLTMDPVAGTFQHYNDNGTYRFDGQDALPSSYKWPDIEASGEWGPTGVHLQLNLSDGLYGWTVDTGDGSGFNWDNVQWEQTAQLDAGSDIAVKVEVIGSQMSLFLNGSETALSTFTIPEGEALAKGFIGFHTAEGRDGKPSYDNLRIYDLTTQGNGALVWSDDFEAEDAKDWQNYWQSHSKWESVNGRFQDTESEWDNIFLRTREELTDFSVEFTVRPTRSSNRDRDTDAGIWLRADPQRGLYANGDTWFRDMVQPGFLDEKPETGDLAWLARRIVSDDRFASSVVKFWWPALMGTDLLEVPGSSEDSGYQSKLRAFEEQQATVLALADDFRNGIGSYGPYNLKDLLVEMMVSPWFRANDLQGPSSVNRDLELADLGVGRLLTPEELENKTKSILGIRWQENPDEWTPDGYRSALSDTGMFRLDYGGIDSVGVKDRSRSLNAVMSNVALSQALQMSGYGVVSDFERDDQNRKIFAGIDPSTTPLSEMNQVVTVTEDNGQVGSYLLNGHLNAGVKTLQVEFLNDWADETGDRNLYVETLIVQNASGDEIDRFDMTRANQIPGVKYQSCDSNPNPWLWCNGYLSVPWEAPSSGTYQFVFKLGGTQGGPDSMQASIAVLTDDVNGSVGSMKIKSKLQELHRIFWGEEYALDSEELQASYVLFVDVWQGYRDSNAPTWIGSEQTNYWTPNGWWDIDHGSAQSDANYIKSTWTSMLIYLMTDYQYLHE